jgi:hypothetical protein
MRKAIPVVLLSMCAALNLFAQNPSRGDHQSNITAMVQRQVKRLTTLLDLTPGKQSSLTDLLSKNAASNQPLFLSMRTANQALHAAQTNNDIAGIQSASTQIGTITGRMTANRAILNAGIAQILTPDQLTKYKALGHAGPGWGFGHRPDRTVGVGG